MSLVKKSNSTLKRKKTTRAKNSTAIVAEHEVKIGNHDFGDATTTATAFYRAFVPHPDLKYIASLNSDIDPDYKVPRHVDKNALLKVLNIPTGSLVTKKLVRAKFLIKAKEFHPDRNPATSDMFKQVVEAYETLSYMLDES
jgi:hypothetical protein